MDPFAAIIARNKNGRHRELSWRELYDLVSQIVQAMRAAGLEPGDRVALLLPNVPEAVAVALAATSIGAVVSSASPDFGVRGGVDRFGQVGPRLLFVADGYTYRGKSYDTLAKVPRIVKGLRTSRASPRQTHDLSSLRTIVSTGSPLPANGSVYVYRHVKRDVHLASVSGGTDLCACFVGGVPTHPVHPGEIQGPVLGMAADVFDADGSPLLAGKGELVSTRPFPSLPLGFLNDDDGSRYQGTYFDRFPGVWCHGDYVEKTGTGGFVIHGRSDATLNVHGVRIGTAEVYRPVEAMDEVAEALAMRSAGGTTRAWCSSCGWPSGRGWTRHSGAGFVPC